MARGWSSRRKPKKRKKSVRKDRRHLHSHARRRGLERYGVKANRKMLFALMEAIHSGNHARAMRVREMSTQNRSVWDVPYEGRTFRVVYDVKRNGIVSFLPPETVDGGESCGKGLETVRDTPLTTETP